MSEWISVKDRLPPEGKFVNVAGINKWTGEIELIPFVAWLLDGEWMCEDAEQQLVNQHGCTVTYWSEIPERQNNGEHCQRTWCHQATNQQPNPRCKGNSAH